MRNYTIFVGRGRCWLHLFFSKSSSFKKKKNQLPVWKKKRTVFDSLSHSMSWVSCVHKSRLWNSHTPNRQHKGITKHENIFFKSRSTGPVCLYIYPYAPVFSRSLAHLHFDSGLCAHTFSHTNFFFLLFLILFFSPNRISALSMHTTELCEPIICIESHAQAKLFTNWIHFQRINSSTDSRRQKKQQLAKPKDARSKEKKNKRE